VQCVTQLSAEIETLTTLWIVTRRGLKSSARTARLPAVAFYAITSIGPLVLIIVAVSGLFYSKEAQTALPSKLAAVGC
jgi:membrane protein